MDATVQISAILPEAMNSKKFVSVVQPKLKADTPKHKVPSWSVAP